MSFTLEQAVKITEEAFNDSNGYFYHTIPHGYSNFIDGMAWVGLLCGASYKVGNIPLAKKCETYLQNLIDVGKDARNYAPLPVQDNWVASQSMPGMWYKEDPQSSAGPLGLQYAINCGAQINVPDYLQNKIEQAKKLTTWGFVFGISARSVSSLRQHLNTMFMAYLVKGKSPSWSLRWAYKENPFFSFVGRKKCSVKYPSNIKLSNVTKITSWAVTELEYSKPNAWVFRRDPFVEYRGDPTSQQYVPIWMVVGEYLQSTL